MLSLRVIFCIGVNLNELVVLCIVIHFYSEFFSVPGIVHLAHGEPGAIPPTFS